MSADGRTPPFDSVPLLEPERTKHVMEVTKHLTTVSTGTLVLLVTLVKESNERGQEIFLTSGFVLLTIAIITASFCQWNLVKAEFGIKPFFHLKPKHELWFTYTTFIAAWITFSFGICFVAMFGIVKLK